MYDGRKADVFAAGVILFTVIFGIFPFQDACSSDKYYKLIMAGDAETYWKTTGISNVPKELENLIFKIFSPDPQNRPTI